MRTSEPDLCQTAGLRVRRRLSAAHATEVRTSVPVRRQCDQPVNHHIPERLSTATPAEDVRTSVLNEGRSGQHAVIAFEKSQPQLMLQTNTEDRQNPILNQRTKNRRSSSCRSLVTRLQPQSLEHESVSFHFQHRSAGDHIVATGHISLLNDVGFPKYPTATGAL